MFGKKTKKKTTLDPILEAELDAGIHIMQDDLDELSGKKRPEPRNASPDTKFTSKTSTPPSDSPFLSVTPMNVPAAETSPSTQTDPSVRHAIPVNEDTSGTIIFDTAPTGKTISTNNQDRPARKTSSGLFSRIFGKKTDTSSPKNTPENIQSQPVSAGPAGSPIPAAPIKKPSDISYRDMKPSPKTPLTTRPTDGKISERQIRPVEHQGASDIGSTTRIRTDMPKTVLGIRKTDSLPSAKMLSSRPMPPKNTIPTVPAVPSTVRSGQDIKTDRRNISENKPLSRLEGGPSIEKRMAEKIPTSVIPSPITTDRMQNTADHEVPSGSKTKAGEEIRKKVREELAYVVWKQNKSSNGN